MPFINFLSEFSALITIISIFITIISLFQTSIHRRRLDNAFFEFREIFLFSKRDKQKLETIESIPAREVDAILSKYEALSASGMHGIRPHSASMDEAEFIFSAKVYRWLSLVRKGVRHLVRGE